MTNVMWFESYWEGMKPEVGGKASSLGRDDRRRPARAARLRAHDRGLPHLPGRRRPGHDPRAPAATASTSNDMAMVSERCGAHPRASSGRCRWTPEVEKSLRHSYAELSRRCGVDDVPVAVRSSATSEDSPDASFAGEHDTYLWIRGADDVVDAVRRCWASLFTDRATCYRVEMGYDHRTVEMSVVVQKMVRPISAGVAFTLNPQNGDRSTVAIDSAWGFGEGVVSGEVTPDNYLVDKVLYEISRRRLAVKEVEYRLTDHDTVEKVPLEAERASAPCLTDAQIKTIARLARTAERHYGCPQDIEWAVDCGPAGGRERRPPAGPAGDRLEQEGDGGCQDRGCNHGHRHDDQHRVDSHESPAQRNK